MKKLKELNEYSPPDLSRFIFGHLLDLLAKFSTENSRSNHSVVCNFHQRHHFFWFPFAKCHDASFRMTWTPKGARFTYNPPPPVKQFFRFAKWRATKDDTTQWMHACDVFESENGTTKTFCSVLSVRKYLAQAMSRCHRLSLKFRQSTGGTTESIIRIFWYCDWISERFLWRYFVMLKWITITVVTR